MVAMILFSFYLPSCHLWYWYCWLSYLIFPTKVD
uniref:Uncharacterized protein n=1 Tax=Rhizophora mucronata TaxID=61149 RepID=A0A2P2JF38_RHIMU